MKTLIGYEMCKLRQRKVLWYVLAALLCANAFFLHHQINTPNELGYSLRELSSVYEEMEGQSVEEQYQWIQETLEDYYETLISGQPVQDGFGQMVGTVMKRIEDLMGYEAYLSQIDAQAEQMMSSALFGRPGTFSYRNISRTPSAYADLKDLELSAEIPDGITTFTEQPVTDAMILLAIGILVLQLALAERESGLFSLIKSKKLGRADTILAKFVALFFCAVGIVTAFYLVNLGMASAELGLGDWNRAIQSVEGYLSSPFKITVGQYIVLFFIAKIGTAFSIACAFFLICILCRNTILSCVMGVLVFGMEGLLWRTIDIHSWMSLLKQLNIAALLDTPGYFSDYVNLNLFGFPVNIMVAGILTGALAVAVGITASAVIFSRESSSGALHICWTRQRKKPNTPCRIHFGLLRYEAYKLLVLNKGILILVLYFAIQTVAFCETNYHIDAETFYYQNYSSKVSGPLSEKSEAFLWEEQERFEAVEVKQQELMEQYENGEISSGYLQYAMSAIEIDWAQLSAYQRTAEQYQQLKFMQAEEIPVYYMDQTPWTILFGDASVPQTAVNWMKLTVVLIFLFASCEAIEHTSCMEELLSVSFRGRGAVTGRKALLGTVIACIVTLLTFVPPALAVFRTYGTGDLSAPGRSILEITWPPAGCSALGVLILQLILRILLAIGCFFIILLLSRKTKSTILTILLSAAIFVLPAFAVFVTH